MRIAVAVMLFIIAVSSFAGDLASQRLVAVAAGDYARANELWAQIAGLDKRLSFVEQNPLGGVGSVEKEMLEKYRVASLSDCYAIAKAEIAVAMNPPAKVPEPAPKSENGGSSMVSINDVAVFLLYATALVWGYILIAQAIKVWKKKVCGAGGQNQTTAPTGSVELVKALANDGRSRLGQSVYVYTSNGRDRTEIRYTIPDNDPADPSNTDPSGS
ncbi:MAG: hypothetical protein NTW79_04505 [Candidatus Berkelbacteria bacterium]|nr:hypothetical protein [Candidatus Berkelbacteria bacterium]